MDSFNYLSDGANIAKKYRMSNDENEKEFLVMQIFTGIYFNLNKLIEKSETEDFTSDFALFLYKNIPKILNSYNEDCSRFLTYLTNYLKNAVKTFYYLRNTEYSKEMIIQNEEESKSLFEIDYQQCQSEEGLLASDIQYLYSKNIDESKIVKFNPKDKITGKSIFFSMNSANRYILLLACKACLFLDDAMIKKIAKKIGLSFFAFSDLIEKLKKDSTLRLDNMNDNLEKVNKFYMKRKLMQKILNSNLDEKTNLYLKAKKSHQANSKFLNKAIKNYKRKIKSPSNQLIANYLQISRGTVSVNLDKALKELYN